MSALPVVCINLPEEISLELAQAYPWVNFISHRFSADSSYESLKTMKPRVLIVGDGASPYSLLEMTQAIRVQLQQSNLFLICRNIEIFNRKQFLRNGADDAFLWMFEKSVFDRIFYRAICTFSPMDRKQYESVRLSDIGPEVVPEFDTFVFMPVNKKYLKFNAKGRAFDSRQLRRLNDRKVRSVYVDTEDKQRFYDYTRERLMAKGRPMEMSDTEREEKSEFVLREVVTEMCSVSGKSIEQGRGLLQQCQDIIDRHYKLSLLDPEIIMFNWTGARRDFYSMSLAVGAIAGAIARIVRFNVPNDLAISGLLHNIGYGKCGFDDRSRRLHPKYSIELIQNSKLLISDAVLSSIAEHHERFDGRGYPNGINNERISKEGFILALAEIYVEISTIQAGRASLSPLTTMEAISQLNKTGTLKLAFDQNLIDHIYSYLLQKQPKGKSKKAA